MVNYVGVVADAALSSDVSNPSASNGQGGVISFLKGRSVSGCSQTVMLVSVAVAIVGIAMSVFSQNMAATIGFSCLGLVSIIGVFIAESAFEGERMLGAIEQLKHQNVLLKQQTQKMSSAVSSIKGENNRLQASNTVLEGKSKELESENASLADLVKNMQHSLKSLTESNKILKEHESLLEKRIAELQHHVVGLREVHNLLIDSNTTFTSNIRDLNRIVSTLSDTEIHLKQMMNMVETEGIAEYPKVKEQLSLAKMLTDQILIFIREDRTAQTGILEKYSQQLSSIEQKFSSIGDLQEFLQSSLQSMRQVHIDIQTSCQDLEKQRAELILLFRQFADKKEEIAHERSKYSEAEESFLSMQEQVIQSFVTPLALLEDVIRQKDLELLQLRRALDQYRGVRVFGSICEAEL